MLHAVLKYTEVLHIQCDEKILIFYLNITVGNYYFYKFQILLLN